MIPAVLAGMTVALLLLVMPVGLVETVVASSGISEAWAAAGPPLGLRARLLLAGFGALMAIGFVWAGHQEHGLAPSHGKEMGRRSGVRGVNIMGFALSKLSWLSRRNAGPSRGGRPALRRADAHPDAPARTPIFASRDFGGLDIFPRTTPARPAQSDAGPAEDQSVVLALPRMAPAIVEQTLQNMADTEFEEVIESAPTDQASVPPSAPPAHALTITELTARLERGLAQRVRGGAADGVLADMPPEPVVPVRDRVEDDVDQALRAALGTLRALAERTR